MRRVLPFAGLFLVIFSAATFAEEVSFDQEIVPLLQKYCVKCHRGEEPKGEFDITSFATVAQIKKARRQWQRVLSVVSDEEMPPEDPLPTVAERQKLVGWLTSVTKIDPSNVRHPGHVTIPRLTREEYNHTMRDLLGIDLRPADRFSEDGEGNSGFNTDRDALFMSPARMDKYLAAAERALDGLIALRREPMQRHLESEDMFMTETKETPKQHGDEFFGYVINRGQMTLYESIDFPADGYYEFRIRARSTATPTGARLRINDVASGDLVVPTTTPAEYALTAFVTRGSHQVAWNIQTPSRERIQRELAKLKQNDQPQKNEEQREQRTLRRKKPKRASVAIDWVRVTGPMVPSTNNIGPPSKETPASPGSSVFIVEPSAELTDSEAAHTVIANFARRAFRRPVEQADIRRYLALYEQAVDRGDSYEQSLRLALTAVLVSPEFLYRLELGPGDEEFRLDDYQLASRLSYFLWTSMPDDELFELASHGKLTRDDILKQQVDRMLSDPRAEDFTRAFTEQWHGFAALGLSIMPDAKKFPEFNAELAAAMKQETALVFVTLLREKRSLLELLDSDETWLNSDLALHYDIEGVQGDEFVRVALQDRNRGGLLGMGSILTATSSSTRTSPVVRGRWVLETLLGQTLPEPPADAGELPGDAGETRTLREELLEHRRNPSCATCHDTIDPIGFGLENFDAIGRFRTEHAGQTIDSKGELPNGTTFDGPAQLKALLVTERKTEFTRNLTRRLLSFAVGRQLQYFDEPTIEKIVSAVEASNFSSRVLLEQIVLSYPFQYQTSRLPVEQESVE